MPKFNIDNFGGGVNANASRRNLKTGEHYLSIGTSSISGTINTSSGLGGELERRPGFRDRQNGLFAAVGNVPITGMAIYRPVNSPGNKRVLVAANQRVHSLSYSGSVLTYANDLTSGYAVPNINPSNLNVQFKQFKDWMFAAVSPDPTSGFGLIYRWDGQVTDATFGGAWGWTLALLDAPGAGPTATAAAAGGRMAFAGTGAAGEYRYGFTFIHGDLGESDMYPALNASALGAATAAGQVTIAAMPWTGAGWRNTSSRRSITGWRLYRTLQTPNLNDDTLNTYYLVVDSTDFATLTYVDVKNDSELVRAYQGDSRPFRRTTAGFTGTLSPQYIEVHRGRMFYGGGQLFDGAVYREYNSVVQWSRLEQPCTFQGNMEIKSQDGFKMTGMKSTSIGLLVFMEDSVHVVTGDSPQTFSQEVLLPGVGCVAPNSICEGDGYIFWLSQAGVVRFSIQSGYSIISKQISPLIERSSTSGRQLASAGFKDGKYYLSLNRHDSSVLVYDNSYASPGSWYRWSSNVSGDRPNPYCWLKLDDVLESGELYFGTDSTGGSGGGRIVQVGGKYTDSGFPQDADVVTYGGASVPVEMSYQSGQYDLGSPDTIKQFKAICIDAEELGNDMIVTWIVDGGAASDSFTITSGKSGTGTEADPYTTAPNTRPIIFSLPQSAFGRYISIQIDASPTGVSSRHKINRVIIDYDDTGTIWTRGD